MGGVDLPLSPKEVRVVTRGANFYMGRRVPRVLLRCSLEGGTVCGDGKVGTRACGSGDGPWWTRREGRGGWESGVN